MPSLRRARVREYAGLPVVRLRQSGARFRNAHAGKLSALRTRRKDGLGLLRLVLRTRFRGGDKPALPRQAIHDEVRERALPPAADAVHALLSLVPQQGQKALEAPGYEKPLPRVWLGYSERVLELLRLVP